MFAPKPPHNCHSFSFLPHVAVVVFIIIHSDLERFSPRVIQSSGAGDIKAELDSRSRTDSRSEQMGEMDGTEGGREGWVKLGEGNRALE